MSARPQSHPDFQFALESERYELLEELGAPFTFDRRAFLRGLGGGLVILCLTLDYRDAEAQRPQRGRGGSGGGPAPRTINAWLHVDTDGGVTVYSGKAEVGQNARTSLSQAAADELRLPIDRVHVVLGDTARTPFDMGTFGSRTTPTMVPQIRKAAAAARTVLIGLAAKSLGADRDGLAVADGKVTDKGTGKSVAFAELTRGHELLETIDETTPTTPAEHWTIAGQSVPKVDGRAFVTGTHRYASDQKRPGMLVGKVLRPVALGATIESLDTSTAAAIPGVKVVRDGEFVGVVASDEPTVTHALAALRSRWKENPPPGNDRNVYALLCGGSQAPARPISPKVNEALSADDVSSVNRAYQIAYIAHAPLEPRAAVAEWEGDKLTVWTGTQRPFGVRQELARAFSVPEESVRVIVPDTGSGYGGKHTGEAALEAGRLARVAGKPVRVVWTREEEFSWAYFRPAGVIETAGGARKDGKLTGLSFHNFNSGTSGIEPPYDIPVRDVAFHNVRSPLRQGSYRALAATANHFARESLVDELAQKVGMDPLAFRLANLSNNRIRAVLQAATARFGWERDRPPSDHGRGIACGTDKGGYVATCAEVAVDRAKGVVKVARLVAAFECGAVVNPEHLQNQIQGALVMGLGGALFEAVKFEAGKIQNPRFSRYRVPRFSDVPAIEVVLLDRKDLPSAGAGETPIVAVAPAVGNAIFDAVGVRLTSLPMVPDGLKL